MTQIAEARPPYVTFEYRAIEDRTASIEAGCYVAKDVAFAFITPAGSKDRLEKIATEWFDSLAPEVQNGRFPGPWLTAFRSAYKDWLEGRETPLTGTSVANWPVVSPAQVKHLLDLRVRTVEDLAAANEETIARLGMGGRALREKAVNWVAAAKDTGKISEQVTSLQQANEDLKLRNEALEEQLKSLAARLDAVAPNPPQSKKL
jgi:FtsZ-binding cell division protein ZapB